MDDKLTYKDKININKEQKMKFVQLLFCTKDSINNMNCLDFFMSNNLINKI